MTTIRTAAELKAEIDELKKKCEIYSKRLESELSDYINEPAVQRQMKNKQFSPAMYVAGLISDNQKREFIQSLLYKSEEIDKPEFKQLAKNLHQTQILLVSFQSTQSHQFQLDSFNETIKGSEFSGMATLLRELRSDGTRKKSDAVSKEDYDAVVKLLEEEQKRINKEYDSKGDFARLETKRKLAESKNDLKEIKKLEKTKTGIAKKRLDDIQATIKSLKSHEGLTGCASTLTRDTLKETLKNLSAKSVSTGRFLGIFSRGGKHSETKTKIDNFLTTRFGK